MNEITPATLLAQLAETGDRDRAERLARLLREAA